MKQHQVHIGKADAGDNVLLAELGARTYKDTFAEDNSPENMAAYLKTAFSPEIQAAELTEPNSLFFIAHIQDTPVGYARLRESAAPEVVRSHEPIEIHRIYAVSDKKRRGIGSALMEACLEEARLRDRDLIWLGVWEKNPKAIAFYQKWDFQIIGNHRFMMGDDPQNDLIMARPL